VSLLVQRLAKLSGTKNFLVVFFDGYCSTVQGLLDWFEVDLGFTRLLFIQIDLCVLCVSLSFSKIVWIQHEFLVQIFFQVPGGLRTCYGVATISRLLKIIGLFCRI